MYGFCAILFSRAVGVGDGGTRPFLRGIITTTNNVYARMSRVKRGT